MNGKRFYFKCLKGLLALAALVALAFLAAPVWGDDGTNGQEPTPTPVQTGEKGGKDCPRETPTGTPTEKPAHTETATATVTPSPTTTEKVTVTSTVTETKLPSETPTSTPTQTETPAPAVTPAATETPASVESGDQAQEFAPEPDREKTFVGSVAIVTAASATPAPAGCPDCPKTRQEEILLPNSVMAVWHCQDTVTCEGTVTLVGNIPFVLKYLNGREETPIITIGLDTIPYRILENVDAKGGWYVLDQEGKRIELQKYISCSFSVGFWQIESSGKIRLMSGNTTTDVYTWLVGSGYFYSETSKMGTGGKVYTAWEFAQKLSAQGVGGSLYLPEYLEKQSSSMK